MRPDLKKFLTLSGHRSSATKSFCVFYTKIRHTEGIIDICNHKITKHHEFCCGRCWNSSLEAVFSKLLSNWQNPTAVSNGYMNSSPHKYNFGKSVWHFRWAARTPNSRSTFFLFFYFCFDEMISFLLFCWSINIGTEFWMFLV